MADKIFPVSGLPIRRTVDLLPQVFKTSTNDKFMAAVIDPLVQPGVLDKKVGYIGRRYGKTYNGTDIYLDTDNTLRSRYQLEPGVILKNNDNKDKVDSFYDYIDFKNQLHYFNNNIERDDLITNQEHYAWNPPIEWDMFVNFREYFWVPAGPPVVKVLGQTDAIDSTYKVRQGSTATWLITPDGLTNNPTLTLYRGQTYKFDVNSPAEPFSIRTAFDTGSLKFNPILSYVPKQLAVYDNKLWRAKTYVVPSPNGIIVEGPDWELVDSTVSTSRLDYTNGVTNNGVIKGTLTFEVPLDAPDVLYYQSATNPDRVGRLIIADIENNTSIDVVKEIVGKQAYTSSNGIVFTSGLVVRFAGNVTPKKYASGNWLVENVGKEITLINFADLAVPTISTNIPEVLFDNAGFDEEPFDDATAYPGDKDYITISRSSIDNNPWSRYNRWFHRSVLDQANKLNGTDFAAADSARAKRPIINFQPNLQLFNHGSVSKMSVDFFDNFTTDVFSTIEGSTGYNIDGEFLFQGARILVTADTDSMANNRIYQVDFITHNNRKEIALRKIDDSESLLGEGVLVRHGNIHKNLMFHFNGTHWVQSQTKTAVNQPPLFDMFDTNGVSFGDTETYPVTSFAGTKIVSYAVGSSTADSELGFSLSFLNIDNVGDILFNFDLDTASFDYTISRVTYSKAINTGFYRFNPFDKFDNGWLTVDQNFTQPIIDSQIITSVTNQLTIKSANWDAVALNADTVLLWYVNGTIHTGTVTREANTFTFGKSFAVNDVVSLRLYSNVAPDQGYYKIPAGLEKNPLNQTLTKFTLGQAIDHISTSLEIDNRFVGAYPGAGNLRDIDGYQNKGMRFLKHSGIAPMAISLLCDKRINIIKSIQHSLRHYTEFKNEFLKIADTVYNDENIADYVDEIFAVLGRAKTNTDPFSDSDMIGTGAHTTINYTVEDEGINVFALTEKFDLKTLSRRSVYLYLNDKQLVAHADYEFDSTFGFVRILTTLAEGDQIEIREYVSTGFCFIPATPTKLGLYKKYLPHKFLDNTYQTPRWVIQGHDGSITAAFNNYKDDLLLELELRIYNNITQEYNEAIFDIDNILGGYYSNSLYNKEQLDSIVNQEFLRWVANSDLDYTNNTYFDSQNSFTYTYSNMTDPLGVSNLPGYWRGVYDWFYDTDRPHTCPWEMLGFSEKPTWWESEYGPAPYTRNNLLLWEDLRDGIIRRGTRAGTYDRYKRPTIMSHIPTDGDGNLLSPLDSGLAGNFTLVNNTGNFKVGDVSPVEYAWRSSSEWPYAVIMALCLMKPFEFITDSFDRSRISINQLGQTISNATGVFFTLDDIVVPEIGGIQVSGLINFVTSYIRSINLDPSVLIEQLSNLDVRLSSRMSGFVDQTEQKFLLDSKNPKSSSSSVFVPPENFDIIFNVSVPMANLSYSGVLIEKQDNGWRVRGYDNHTPYFLYNKPVKSTTDPYISVGGKSEAFLDWTPNKTYNNGAVVRVNNTFFRSLKTHISGASFDNSLWKILPELPTTGATQAYFRRTFNTLQTSKMIYGTVLPTIQDVVDFLLGYEFYLKSVGFNFDRYDSENQVAYNWQTSCKEFMFWTKHNWAAGSLLSLSPSAHQVDINIPLGVADSLFDSFYEYQIFKADATPLMPNYIDVKRDFQQISVSTVNTTEGIFFIKLHFVLKEHVTIFSDRTVFNDVIYDKTTGYRQERIKARGFRTVDWDGDYTSPGFLFDNVDIAAWQTHVDYKLGDIVSYRGHDWTSLENQNGVADFDDTKWSRLDVTPTKGLISNFDYKINQFADYYESDADGLGSSQRDLSRHVIGYQTREYLQNIAEDSVSQFKIYQGFIREKGSSNAITKVFDKLSRTNEGSVSLNEEWAFRVGRFGGLDQFNQTEFRLYKDQFLINPQPILLNPPLASTDVLDQYLRVPQANFTISAGTFTKDINPTSKYELTPRVAGYVNTSQVDVIVKTRDDILNLDIANFGENTHVWVTFDNNSWNVLRYNKSDLLVVTHVTVAKTRVELSLAQPHSFVVGDIFGIRQIPKLVGFHKITEITSRSIVIQVAKGPDDNSFDASTLVNLEIFTEARYKDYQTVNLEATSFLTEGARLWIDSNADSNWEVVEKQNQFSYKSIADYGTSVPASSGTAVIYSDVLTQTISSMPGSNLVVAYVESTDGLKPFQLLQPANAIASGVTGVFGTKLAISPDGRWLAVGSPNASGIKSDYNEMFDVNATYPAGAIVQFNGKLWRAKDTVVGDGSTINTASELWESVSIVAANESGTNPGYYKQGAITLYEWQGQAWVEQYSFVSPRQTANELYGNQITLGQDGTNYYMAVSAPGALDNKGRVYLYKYSPVAAVAVAPEVIEVTVGAAEGSESGYKYYLNGQYRPNLTFLVGSTYIFDQTNYTNVYFPNPSTSIVVNPHPLNFSADNISGENGGGSTYETGVTYLLDNSEVTQAQYLAGFSVATTRKVQITVTEKTAGLLYYWSSTDTLAGNSVIKRNPTIAKEWKHLENQNYAGVFTLGRTYTVDAIVWHNNSLWKSLIEQTAGSIVPGVDTTAWQKLDPVSTQCSLPTNASIDDDGSTLAEGLLSSTQMAELVKKDDRFGSSLAMSRDGGILVVGAPYGDGQYFANYKGLWSIYQEYVEGDTVRFNDVYYRLAADAETSSYTSIAQNPTAGAPWATVTSVESLTGKIFVYQRNANDVYELKQTIAAGNLADINDIKNIETLKAGDQFGFALDIDLSGTTIVVSSPLAERKSQTQGAVYVFKTTDTSSVSYRLKQKLQSFETLTNELFGFSVSISERTERIVVGAKNAPFKLTTRFDIAQNTKFDTGRTRFSEDRGYPGQVYVFELEDQTYILADKLQANLGENESFGYSVDSTASVIVAGSPDYKLDVHAGNFVVGRRYSITKIGSTDWNTIAGTQNIKYVVGNTITATVAGSGSGTAVSFITPAGITRIFRKDPTKKFWQVLEQEKELVNIELLKSVSVYDDIKKVKIVDLDIVNHSKMKILGIAEEELKFKTPYDPATYTNGTADVSIDEDQAWFERNVGVLWWNLSTVKWVHAEQGDVSYRLGHWNQQAVGSSVDIYEWVESPVTPADWAKLADTTAGLANNISGTPLYNNAVYSVKVFSNPNTGLSAGTKYYFWVKNKTVVPQDVSGRRISAADVTNLITNPIASGIPMLAIIDTDKFIAYNLGRSITSDSALINIEYYKSDRTPNEIHSEYQLLVEGVADSLPTSALEQKWLDSLIGFNGAGQPVPDPTLLPKQRYGIDFRPIQTMFVDRAKALQIAIDSINSVLTREPFTDLIDFENLNKVDAIPSALLNLYDITVDTLVDLAEVGTVRVKKAILSINLIDGEVDTIDIINSGFGYKVPPPVEITGNGIGAKAEVTLDNQGRIVKVTVLLRGKKYTYASATVRNFSVLVVNDSSVSNSWSINAWDTDRQQFFKSSVQSYDTTQYWSYIDWYAPGVSKASQIIKEINSLYLEPTITVKVGSIIRIKEYGNGGWALLSRVADGTGTILNNYNLVGRQGGTIKISEELYNTKVYDASPITYDEQVYDKQPSKELRFIFAAVKENIFIDELNTEWNKLFFTSIRYVFSEQLYIDWAFKTSFLNAIHNVGTLEQRATYKNDNLESFQSYLEEVKPYRTTIREYTSRYTKMDHVGSATTDFDLPPVYSTREGRIIPVNELSSDIEFYPWKSWADNRGYSIVSINISNVGTNYSTPPNVVIEGDGTGAEAQAYISNGSLSGIRLISTGKNYTHAPSVSLVGGNGTSADIAKAVAILGDGKVRTFNTAIKFDRITKSGSYQSYSQTETFVADGYSATFNLTYPPTRDKTKISVLINSELVLRSDYNITLYTSNLDSYTIMRGKLVLASLPTAGDTIVITYEKNDDLLDSVDRINKYYAPTSGMLGKDVGQLMTGIDFGGVQIQGTTFDVSGGWDALPWFTDNWDSVEPSADHYIVADGSTNYVTSPTVPALGQVISIYIKRFASQKTTRLDDPNFGTSGNLVNKNAVMPSFVGDGSTSAIDVGNYIRIEAGDTIILRPVESDGSVVINDPNIIDTNVSGGSLASMSGAYSTATGMNAEDITIDGSKFISPDQVPAPEENIPGQILDSVSIKVFHTVQSGAAPLQSVVRIGNGVTVRYPIGQQVMETSSVVVYIDKIKQGITGADSSIDYEVDYITNSIVFITAPEQGSVIEIISIGVGGIAILDYQEFIADGETNLFLTRAEYSLTKDILVTVDGLEATAGFINSTGVADATNRTMVQFPTKPARRAVVKMICLGTPLDTDASGKAVVRVNQQQLYFDNSTRSFELDNFVNLSRASATGAMLVEINGIQLIGVDTNFVVYDGTNNIIEVGKDPAETFATITEGNIKVYINNKLQRFILDYVYDGNSNTVTVNKAALKIADEIRIEIDLRSLYSVVNNTIVLSSDLTLTQYDNIIVTWFSEYPSMNIVTDEFTGGKVHYQLSRQPVSASYVWVYRNGQRLSEEQDYDVIVPRNVIYMKSVGTPADKIKIVQFGTELHREPVGYEVFKDMLNIYHYKRFSMDRQVSLSAELQYFDKEIQVTDATGLFSPIREKNIPGVVYIGNERIEYFVKTGTTLSQLRRGSFGTSIATVYPVGKEVIDISPTETVPYNETQDRADFISDGSSMIIGPLDYVPAASARTNWTRDSIPTTYSPCDQIEVFVAGQRMRKDPITIYDETLGVASPAADKILEADFSVDGITPYLRLTHAVPAGTRITVIRRTGTTWYDQGVSTATSGITLTKNTNPVMKFLTQKSTELPE